MMRIVSLLPGITETLIALGAEGHLVGRTHDVDFPAVAAVPVVTLPGHPLELNPTEAPAATEVVQHRLSALYQVNSELLASLQPDVILTRYPAADMPDRWADIRQWAMDSIGLVQTQVRSSNPASVQDVIDEMRVLAAQVNQAAAAAQLVDTLQRHLVMIAQRAKMTPSKPSVVMIGQLSPLMTVGGWIPSLLGMAGAENLFGLTGHDATYLDLRDLSVADPDIIIVSNPGCDLAALQATFADWSHQAQWLALRAVQAGQVYLVDTHHYFAHPSPRLSETLEILAEICHPTHFGFGHEGRGWLRIAQS